MGAFARVVLDLADQDWGWWPFVRYRPRKEQRLTFARGVSLTLLYGVVYGSALGALFAAARLITWPSIIVFVVLTTVAMGMYFPILGRFWNQRVAALTRGTESQVDVVFGGDPER